MTHTQIQRFAICQVWKENVLPLLQQDIAEQLDSMTTYMLIQHEAAVANLLEVSQCK